MEHRLLRSVAVLARSTIAIVRRSLLAHVWLRLGLAGLLSIGANLWLLSPVAQASPELLPIVSEAYELAAKPANTLTAKIPAAVVDRLRQDLSKRTKLSPAKLKAIAATPKTWSNGCLNLAQPDEICTQALVSGWRVIFSSGSQRWVYRTDQQGRNRRLEPPARRQ